MKLTPQTVNVLKNFVGINVNLAVEKGNILRTIGPARNIFAKATLPDTFPNDFAIYDLNSFIQALTLFADADVDFSEKFLKVKTGGSTIKYFFADPSIVQAAPNKEIVTDKTLFTFDLTADDVASIGKIASALAAPAISVTAKDGKAELILNDRKNATSHSFNKDLGECDEAFDVSIRVETFKLLPGPYTCEITKKGPTGVVIFSNKDVDLKYWLTVETDSKV